MKVCKHLDIYPQKSKKKASKNLLIEFTLSFSTAQTITSRSRIVTITIHQKVLIFNGIGIFYQEKRAEPNNSLHTTSHNVKF